VDPAHSFYNPALSTATGKRGGPMQRGEDSSGDVESGLRTLGGSHRSKNRRTERLPSLRNIAHMSDAETESIPDEAGECALSVHPDIQTRVRIIAPEKIVQADQA
jgi:hypothetical protein